MINIRVYVRRDFRSLRWSLWRGWEKYWWTEPWWQWWRWWSQLWLTCGRGRVLPSTRISPFHLSISPIEIWLGFASCLAGKSGVWGKAVFESNTHFFPNQGFWVDFFPNTTFFTVGLRKDGQGQRVPFYYYDNTTPSPNRCCNISEFKRNFTKRMFFITTGILHH